MKTRALAKTIPLLASMEVCVDGWRRAFDGIKEFVSYRINAKIKEEHEAVRVVEKRYSQLLEFHNQVDKSKQNELLCCCCLG